MRFLLDTSAAIILRDAGTDHDGRLLKLDSIPALSIVSVVEMEGGIMAAPRLAEVRRRLLDRMLGQFPVLDFDRACLRAYRRIVEVLGFSRPRVIDRMIAATALAHRLTVVTSNARDFRDVPGLAIEAWPAIPPPS